MPSWGLSFPCRHQGPGLGIDVVLGAGGLRGLGGSSSSPS